jgi:ABC-2 type transport system permease protein
MKKYYYIFKTSLMSGLQYVTNNFVGFFHYFIITLVLYYLWKYMYQNGTDIINGYSLKQMIWYVLFGELLFTSFGGRKACIKVSNDIKEGNIVYKLNKPYSYLGYVISDTFGEVFLRLVLYSIVGMIVGFLLIGPIDSFKLIYIPFIIIVSLLAVFTNILFTMLIALFSFKIEDSTPFYWIYNKFILVLGTILPFEFFPLEIQKFLLNSPVFAIAYGPSKLVVSFSFKLFLNVLLVQIIYIFITYLLCSLVYRKGVNNLNVNGG